MAEVRFFNAETITVVDLTRNKVSPPEWVVPDVSGDPDWAMDCAEKKIVVTIAAYLED